MVGTVSSLCVQWIYEALHYIVWGTFLIKVFGSFFESVFDYQSHCPTQFE